MAVERWRPFGVSVEPFRNLNDIQGEMNRLFDSETKDDLTLTFEIPGVREKDLNVSITGDLLTVKGERQFVEELKEESYHRIEWPYGKFARSVQLPVPVQADKVKATYRDGVLEVSLPKADEVKPKEIKIDIL